MSEPLDLDALEALYRALRPPTIGEGLALIARARRAEAALREIERQYSVPGQRAAIIARAALAPEQIVPKPEE